MSLRTSLRGLIVVMLLASACNSDDGPPVETPTSAAPTTADGTTAPPKGFAEEVACGLPPQWLLRIYNGYNAERSADIQILPKVPNFIGAALPHVGPWDFTSDVPMFWYGPGYIKPIGPVQEPVTLADIAATLDHLLDSSFEPVDGVPMLDALVPAEERPEPPRLIIVQIWDGAGRNVLAQWPDAWPNLAAMRPEGAWYEHATVGSSPTSSAQDHAIVGTGAFPSHHGVVGHTLRIDGQLVSPWKDGPRELLVETFADHYDLEHDNRPLIGESGTVPIQLGMMSRGAFAEGGDKDLAVLRTPGNAETLGAEGVEWNLPAGYEEWYEYAPYANDLPALSTYFDDVELDMGDGKRDGLWHGRAFEDSEELLDGFHTPARVPYQTRLIEEMITREGFGADETPDLFYVNYKLIDALGHLFGIQDPAIRDALAAQDASFVDLIDFLNEKVGEGRWVILTTADHGSLKSVQTTGAFQISGEAVASGINQQFDTDGDETAIVEQVKQTEIFINVPEAEEQDVTLEDISRFIMDLRQSDVPFPGFDVPSPNEKVFEAAFPAEVLTSLPCLPPQV
jgi:Type I phosphodiesterase / nucleotide pyrophosphatase